MIDVGPLLQRVRDATLERYETLPAPLQDVVCSAYGIQEVVRRRGSTMSARRRMRPIETLHWDRQQADTLVERRLRRILDIARELPGYASGAPGRSAGSALEELGQWPGLGKPALQADPEGYMSRKPQGSDIFSLTSGTTGTPLKIWRTRNTFRELFTSSEVAKSWFGVPLGSRRASFTGKLVVPLGSRRIWRINLPGKQLVLSQYHLGPRRIEAYARALRAWRPKILDGYTSNLVELAGLMDERGIRIHIPLVVTTCEVLTTAARALLERVFGGRVSDKYGSSENVVLATECPEGSRHVFRNMGIIEAVDEADRPLPPGAPGRLLLTTLTNDLMPLVRYDIGDVGSVDPSTPCSCGRISPVLREILGRQDDVVVTRDGRRIGIFAFNILRGLGGVVAMQVVQHAPDSFEVRAKLENESGEARTPFEKAIAKAFDRLVGPDQKRRVTFTYPETIERDPGGKIRNVVRAF
jgi:phenylacetate-CoA ligase